MSAADPTEAEVAQARGELAQQIVDFYGAEGASSLEEILLAFGDEDLLAAFEQLQAASGRRDGVDAGGSDPHLKNFVEQAQNASPRGGKSLLDLMMERTK